MRDDRNRQAEALADLDILPQDQIDGAAGWLLKTFVKTSYPTAVSVVFACHPVWVDAADTEGATPSFTVDSTVEIYALNLGTLVPPVGTIMVGTAVGGRVTIRY